MAANYGVVIALVTWGAIAGGAAVAIAILGQKPGPGAPSKDAPWAPDARPADPPRLVITIDRNDGPPQTFPQIGYLTSSDGGGTMPLYGKPSSTRRGRFYYYTVIRESGVKVPVVAGRRDCLDEVGCPELYDGDTVDVATTAGAYQVHLYASKMTY